MSRKTTIDPKLKRKLMLDAGYTHPERGTGKINKVRLINVLQDENKNSNRYKAAKKLVDKGVHQFTTVFEVDGPSQSRGDYNFREVCFIPNPKDREKIACYTRWTGYSGY